MSISIKENYPLAGLTTLGVGGAARYFAEIRNVEEAKEAVKLAKERGLPIFVLSGGSNVLISDDGFNGLVILNRIDGIKSEVSGGKTILRVGAGEIWDKLVEYAARHNFQGLECLSGIPGSVGASPVQNIGAYGAEVGKYIIEVTAIDLQRDEVVKLSKEDCKFGYRQSIFNTTEEGRYIILEVVFELSPNVAPELKYKDLIDYFAGKSAPTLEEARNAVLEMRARKGMVIHPDYESYQSAGSFFKNSVVSKTAFEKVFEMIGADDGKWFWALPDGRVKISAAKLIEKSGFGKGFKLGKAGISPKHSLSIINLGGAKAVDLINLANDITKSVQSKFGVTIEPEVRMVGFVKSPLMNNEIKIKELK